MKAVESLETFGGSSDLVSAERMAQRHKPLSLWWGVAAAIPLLAVNIGIWIAVIVAIGAAESLIGAFRPLAAYGDGRRLG